MLTRKYYNMIARKMCSAVNAAQIVDNNEAELEEPSTRVDVLSYLVTSLCDEFKQDDPNFDADKFRKACGL